MFYPWLIEVKTRTANLALSRGRQLASDQLLGLCLDNHSHLTFYVNTIARVTIHMQNMKRLLLRFIEVTVCGTL